MKTLAIIPARAGSKGVVGKNKKLLLKKPLINYTIEAALNSRFIDHVAVSSDDNEILDFCKNYPIETIERGKEIATDSSLVELAIEHAILQFTAARKTDIDIVILLQPTSPLRTNLHIDEAFDTYQKYLATSKEICLVSGFRPKTNPYKLFKFTDTFELEGLFGRKYLTMPRQTLPHIFEPNGAIYIFNKHIFLKSMNIFTGKIIPYEMSEEESLDIDTYKDFINAESYLSRTQESKENLTVGNTYESNEYKW